MDRVLNGATLEMKVCTCSVLRAFPHTKRLSDEIKHFYPTRRKSQQFDVNLSQATRYQATRSYVVPEFISD